MNFIDFLILFLCALIGIGFHVMQKVGQIMMKYQAQPPKAVFKAFFQSDWNTLITSGITIVAGFIIFRGILRQMAMDQSTVAMKFILKWREVIFIILGYSGQIIAYKFLGTAEKVIVKKIDTAGGETNNPNPDPNENK